MTSPTTHMFCKSCEYALTGVSGGVCPECGRAFDPADAATFGAKPFARQRKWIRRGAWVAGAIIAAELFAPSRVAKLAWSWPNPDGVTAMSETRWCLVAPHWFPIKYPRWTSARWTKTIEPQGLVVSEQRFWRIGLFTIRSDGSGSSWVPTQSMGMTYGTLGTKNAAGERNMYDMMPENLDKVTDLLVYPEPDAVQLDYSVRVIPLKKPDKSPAPASGNARP